MNVLLALHGMRPEFTGGCEIHVEELARSLLSEGHACSILAGTRDPSLDPGLHTDTLDGLTVYRLKRPDRFSDNWFEGFSPFVESELLDFFASQSFDVLHVHHWKRLSVNLVEIATRCGIPCVVTMHDLWSTCPREYRLLEGEVCERSAGSPECPSCAHRIWWQSEGELERGLSVNLGFLRQELDLARHVLVPSETHRTFLARVHGVDPTRLEVVPLAIDEARFETPAPESAEAAGPNGAASQEETSEGAEAPATAARFPEGPLRIGYWGHLVEFKGPDVAVESLASLADPERVELHVFGTADIKQYELRLSRRAARFPVVFHGAFAPGDVRAAELDIAVIPSRCQESYSLVLDEAFAMGMPAIVSDRGALAERVGDAGLTFTTGDPKSLAERIDELVKAPERFAEMRRAASDRSAPMSAHASRVAQFYESAIEAGPATVPDDRSLMIQSLSAARAALEERTRQVEQLRESSDRAENLAANLERYREVNRELDNDRRGHKKVIEELRADLQGHAESLAAFREENTKLHEAVEAIQADLDAHRKAVAQYAEDRAEVQKVVDAQAADLEAHRSVLDQLREERARFEADIHALLEQSTALQDEIERRGEEIDRVQADQQATRARAEHAEAAHAQVTEQLVHREQHLAELAAHLDRIHRTLAYRIYRAVRGGKKGTSSSSVENR